MTNLAPFPDNPPVPRLPRLPDILAQAIRTSTPIPYQDGDGKAKEYPVILPTREAKDEAVRALIAIDDLPRIKPSAMRAMLSALNAVCAPMPHAPRKTPEELDTLAPLFLRTLTHIPGAALTPDALDKAMSKLAYFPAPAQLLPIIEEAAKPWLNLRAGLERVMSLPTREEGW